MARDFTVMALDIGIVSGWTVGTLKGDAPHAGVWLLPELPGHGKRGAAFENVLEEHLEMFQPDLLAFAVRFAANQTTAYLLTGLAFCAEVSAYRCSVVPKKISESEARKAVLGRGGFSDYDGRGKAIKGTATPKVKAAALDWCRNKGWAPNDHNVADAMVIFEFERRVQLAKKQWATA